MAVALSLILVCLAMFGVSIVVGVFIGWLDDRRFSAWTREQTASTPARHRSVA
jgi:hypothetical protein